MTASLRLAVSALTRLPVRSTSHDPTTVGRAMALAPIVGLALGGVAATVAAGVAWCVHGASLLPAATAVVALAALTGALHLDGLADTADALGVPGDAAAARAAAKAPSVGVFGVVAVMSVVLVEVAALATAVRHGRATSALVMGCGTGRLAATWSCRATAAATDVGLGAWVARTVSTTQASLSTVAVAVVSAAVIALDVTPPAALLVLLAGAVGLLVGDAVRRAGCRRFGGLTGDVLGATISCASASSYLVVALTVRLFS
jgi:adenosylcobinamide-GDP ribazoletransferase